MQVVAGQEGIGLLGRFGQGEVAGAGAGAEGLREEGLRVLGVSVASLAVTGLATGGAATPAAGLGLLLMLLGGLSLAAVPMLRRRGM